MNFKDMGLTFKPEHKTINFAGTEVRVVTDLPSAEIYDMIMITIQEAMDGGFLNPYKLDIYFHTNFVLMFTNIAFDQEDTSDMPALYDKLKSSGLMDMVCNVIEDKYNELFMMTEEVGQAYVKYKASTSAMIQSIINDLPQQAEAMGKIIEDFDQDKFQNVINFATANGMNNAISTDTAKPYK